MTTLAREKNNTSRMRTYVKNKEETNLLDLFKEKCSDLQFAGIINIARKIANIGIRIKKMNLQGEEKNNEFTKLVNNEAYAHDYIKFLVIKYEISKEDVKKIVDFCYRNITDMSEEKCNQMLEKIRKNEYKLSDEIFQKKKKREKERDEERQKEEEEERQKYWSKVYTNLFVEGRYVGRMFGMNPYSISNEEWHNQGINSDVVIQIHKPKNPFGFNNGFNDEDSSNIITDTIRVNPPVECLIEDTD